MAIVNDDGRSLYYEDSGSGDSVYLFLHGFLLDHSLWSAAIQALPDTIRTVAMDVRGHGMSATPGPSTMADLADDAIAVLDHLGIERAVLVGHSQGGFASLEAALRHPRRVAGLILVDTAPGPPGAEAEAQLRQAAELWCTEGPIGPFAQGMAQGQVGPGPIADALVSRWQTRPPASWRDPWTTVIDGHRGVRDQLSQITCPALVVLGTLDAGFEAGAREFVAELPGCMGLIEIGGAYHAPPLTHPGEIAQAVLRFHRESAPTGAS